MSLRATKRERSIFLSWRVEQKIPFCKSAIQSRLQPESEKVPLKPHVQSLSLECLLLTILALQTGE